MAAESTVVELPGQDGDPPHLGMKSPFLGKGLFWDPETDSLHKLYLMSLAESVTGEAVTLPVSDGILGSCHPFRRAGGSRQYRES
jgi:hypothetical protein